MNTYNRTHSRSYRRIYEKHYGPIPKDELGRSYEIHHKDGNHANNDINNLQLVTIEEHFNIHYAQGDMTAASMISKRMHYALTSEQLSEIARHSVKDQIERGVHNFSNPELHAEYTRRAIERGTHCTQDSALQSAKGKKGAAASRTKRTRRFAVDNPNTKMKTCERCGVTTTAPAYGKCHGPKCGTTITYKGKSSQHAPKKG